MEVEPLFDPREKMTLERLFGQKPTLKLAGKLKSFRKITSAAIDPNSTENQSLALICFDLWLTGTCLC